MFMSPYGVQSIPFLTENRYGVTRRVNPPRSRGESRPSSRRQGSHRRAHFSIHSDACTSTRRYLRRQARYLGPFGPRFRANSSARSAMRSKSGWVPPAMSLTLVREAEAAATGKLSAQAVQGPPPAFAERARMNTARDWGSRVLAGRGSRVIKVARPGRSRPERCTRACSSRTPSAGSSSTSGRLGRGPIS